MKACIQCRQQAVRDHAHDAVCAALGVLPSLYSTVLIEPEESRWLQHLKEHCFNAKLDDVQAEAVQQLKPDLPEVAPCSKRAYDQAWGSDFGSQKSDAALQTCRLMKPTSAPAEVKMLFRQPTAGQLAGPPLCAQFKAMSGKAGHRSRRCRIAAGSIRPKVAFSASHSGCRSCCVRGRLLSASAGICAHVQPA